MKIFNLMLLVALSAGSVIAQSSAGGPGVEVLKSQWRQVERNLKLEQDPLLVIEQSANLQSAIKEALSANQARVKANQPLVPIPTRGSASSSMPTGSWGWYSYEIQVRNTGTKTIRRLTWEYTFFDPNQVNIRARQFHSKAKILPGMIKKLIVNAGPPRGIVNANQVSKMPADNSPQQVIIQRVEYADGSVWTRPVPSP